MNTVKFYQKDLIPVWKPKYKKCTHDDSNHIKILWLL